MSGDWLDRGGVAADRILDAAERLFAAHGPDGVAMAALASAAGCSRATLYRYFPDRRALQRAFVEREAIRVGERVAAELADPDVATERTADRVTEGVLAALRQVRARPTLLAWFDGRGAGVAADLAQASEVIEVLGRSVTADPDAARWVVRAVVSLLTVPGRDPDDERALVARFVAPVVAADG